MKPDFLIFSAIVLALTACLYGAVWRRNFRLIHWATLGLTVLILPVTWLLAERGEERERDRLMEPLMGFAPTYAGEMARQGHAKITAETPPDDPAYLQLIAAQKDWLKANPRISSIYTYRLDPARTYQNEPGEPIHFVVCAEVDYNRDGVYAGEDEERLAIGEVYEETDREMLEVFNGKPLFSGEPVQDDWGTWVAAYAPVFGPDGKVEAAVGVDFDARTWTAALQRARSMVMAFSGVFFLIFAGAVTVATSLLTMQSARRDREVAAITLAGKQKLEALVNSIEGVVFEKDAETGRFTFMSPQADRILGAPVAYWREEGHWESHIHPDDRASAGSGRTAATPGSYSMEYRVHLPGNRLAWLRETGNSVASADGKPEAVRGILTDITKQKKAAEELEMTHRRLVDTSRRAGMAEVATGVLHNVGNVLNSVNVASTLIHKRIHDTRVAGLGQLAGLLKSQNGSLGQFFQDDPRAKIIPDYLSDLAGHLQEEQTAVLTEVDTLVKNVEHIKNIVDLQQSYSRTGGTMEPLEIKALVADAIGINSASLTRHRIQLEKHFEPGLDVVHADKSKVLQILVNLIRNAKHAVDDNDGNQRVIRIMVQRGQEGRVRITVEDTGVGICAGNMAKLFSHGFTTRKDGHGFGLHSSEAAAREMGGSLTVHSDGPGLGASFTLELRAAPAPASDSTPVAAPADTPEDPAFPVSFLPRGTTPLSSTSLVPSHAL